MDGFWLLSYVILWVLVVLLLLTVFLLLRQLGQGYLGTAEGVSRDGLATGTPAPTFEASDLDGRAVSLPTDFSGWRLFIFGRSLCPPCHALAPDLSEIGREMSGKLSTVFISQSDMETTRVFVEESHLAVSVVWTESQSPGDAYQVRVSPFGFLLDPEGIIRSKGLVNGRGHIELLFRSGGLEFDSDQSTIHEQVTALGG